MRAFRTASLSSRPLGLAPEFFVGKLGALGFLGLGMVVLRSAKSPRSKGLLTFTCFVNFVEWFTGWFLRLLCARADSRRTESRFRVNSCQHPLRPDHFVCLMNLRVPMQGAPKTPETPKDPGFSFSPAKTRQLLTIDSVSPDSISKGGGKARAAGYHIILCYIML